jgi:lipopolysaccharide/colanic/teichoic acid biosynthesis glycosyltransferase
VWSHTRAYSLKKSATEKALDRSYTRYWSVWLDLALLIEAISKVA